jgi:hypothetical protein
MNSLNTNMLEQTTAEKTTSHSPVANRIARRLRRELEVLEYDAWQAAQAGRDEGAGDAMWRDLVAKLIDEELAKAPGLQIVGAGTHQQ